MHPAGCCSNLEEQTASAACTHLLSQHKAPAWQTSAAPGEGDEPIILCSRCCCHIPCSAASHGLHNRQGPIPVDAHRQCCFRVLGGWALLCSRGSKGSCKQLQQQGFVELGGTFGSYGAPACSSESTVMRWNLLSSTELHCSCYSVPEEHRGSGEASIRFREPKALMGPLQG